MRAHYVLTCAIVVLFLSSCKDEPAEVGEEFFPSNLIDTELDRSAKNELKAQNLTSDEVDFKNKFDYLMLGEYDDPKYGSIKASFASELILGKTYKDYGINSLLNDTVRVIDTTYVNNEISSIDTSYIPKYESIEYLSADFKIRYGSGAWLGDTLAKHKVSVYELSSILDSAANYTSDYDPALVQYDISNPIGELEYYVKNNTVDTMWLESGYTHVLQVELDDEIGLKLFDADGETINNLHNFRDLFKGVFVTTEKTNALDGSLLRLNYKTLDQGVYVNYRGLRYEDDINGNDSVVYDTLSWDFPIKIESTKAIKYTRDYSNTDIDFTEEDADVDRIYLQGMGGTMAKVNITDKYINDWKAILPEKDEENDEKITSIASVELTFYVDTAACYSEDDEFRGYLPDNLVLYIKNSEGEFTTPLFDLSDTSTDVAMVSSGGSARSTSEGGIEYTFTLQTGFFEEFIRPTLAVNGDRSFNELYLMIPSSNFSFNRVILHGMSIKDHIEDGIEDETVLRSNLSVRYVEVE